MAIAAASAEDVSGIVELAPVGTAGRTEAAAAAWSNAGIEERAVVTEVVADRYVSPHSLLQRVLALLLLDEPLTETTARSPPALPTANLRAISPPPRANTIFSVK